MDTLMEIQNMHIHLERTHRKKERVINFNSISLVSLLPHSRCVYTFHANNTECL